MTHVQGEPWADMPRDGSGRPGRLEMIILGMIALLCFTVAGWVGAMVWDYSHPSPVQNTTVNVTVPEGRESSQRLITRGAYWSWSVTDACDRGPRECDGAVSRANTEAARYGLKVWRDGSVSPR